MSTEVVVPALGESVTEATVAGWLKANGDIVAQDEPIVELETDKVTVEVNSPTAGVLDFANFEVGNVLEKCICTFFENVFWFGPHYV